MSKRRKEKSERLRNHLKYSESIKRDYLNGNILGYHLVNLKSDSSSASGVKIQKKDLSSYRKKNFFSLPTGFPMHGSFNHYKCVNRVNSLIHCPKKFSFIFFIGFLGFVVILFYFNLNVSGN